MPEAVSPSRRALLQILGRMRRRLRWIAALEGAVGGASAGLIAAAGLAAAARWVGTRAGTLPALVAVGLAALGAAALSLRRISPSRCARLVDRALDGQDRILSALWISRAEDAGGASPFIEAAVRDAVARARRVPLAAAAPLRRPRGLWGVGVGTAALLLAVAAPVPRRLGVASVAPRAAGPAEPLARIPLASLDAEQEEAAAAVRAAGELGDQELGAIARELARTIAALGESGLPRGELLDRLAELERRAAEAALEAERMRAGLEKSGRALERDPRTREAGRAMAAHDGDGAESAMRALAEEAAKASSAERDRLARALESAAEQAAMTGAPPPGGDERGSAPPSGGAEAKSGASATDPGSAGNEEERQRRLARDGAGDNAGSAERGAARSRAPGERRLQRLERDLREASKACREDPARCRRGLEQAARDLPKMEREAQSSDARRRMSEAIRQLRERMRRDPNGTAGRGSRAGRKSAEERFQRMARGEMPVEPGEGQPGDSGGRPSAETEVELGMDDGGDIDGAGSTELGDDGEGQGTSRAEAEATAAAASPGPGVGAEGGAAPLGARATSPDGARGQEREAQVRDGAGPSRAEQIQAAARRGFTQRGYARVFGDYAAVIEESLQEAAVPPGRRYLVRRYFQLIRPRAATAPRSP